MADKKGGVKVGVLGRASNSTLERFLEAGGIVQELPPEKINPNKFKTAGVIKPSKKAGLRSQYPPIKRAKGEELAARLNLGNKDFADFSYSGGYQGGITAEQIHAALAGHYREHEEAFLMYLYTEEQRYYSRARTLMLTRAAGDAAANGWKVKKRGVMTAMAEAALDCLARPDKYRRISDREWAKRLGLSCNKDWPQRWRYRFNLLIEYGTELREDGYRVLAKNF